MKPSLSDQLNAIIQEHPSHHEFELFEHIQYELNKWKCEQLQMTETPPHVREIWRKWNAETDLLKSQELLSLSSRDWIEQMGGIRKGEILCWAGRPKMGKSSVLQFVVREVIKNHKTLLIAPELNERYIIQRMLAAYTQLPHHLIQQGELTEEMFEQVVRSAETLFTKSLHIHSHYYHHLNEYIQFLEASIVRDKMEIICIDDFHSFGNKWDQYHYQEVNLFLRAIKRLATQYQVTFLLTAPVHESVEESFCNERKPRLQHLYPYHHLVDIADKVIFLYRAEQYDIRIDEIGNTTSHRVEWIIGKNKSAPPRSIHFTRDTEFSDFRELTITSPFLHPF